MTLLAVDYGKRRLGIAVTDSAERIALSLGVIDARTEAGGIGRIREMSSGRGVREIIVGVALSKDGGETDMSRRARAFGDRLGDATGIPVTFADERHSTDAAEAPMIEAGMSGRKRRGRIDAGAAVIILQNVIRSRARG